MRFGAMLAIWLKYIGISVEDFAPFADKHPQYLGALRRGRKGTSGTTTPSQKTQREIFDGLEKAIKKYLKKNIAINSDGFWAGPQLPVFQQEIASIVQAAGDPPHDAQEPHRMPGHDLSELLEYSTIHYRGRILTDRQKTILRQFVEAALGQ